MARVKRGVTAHRRHKKVLNLAKGYYGARSRVYRVAVQAVTKAGQYAFRDRRVKKRTFRTLWLPRSNAQARAQGNTYRQLTTGLKKRRIQLDRRVRSESASRGKPAFASIVDKAKAALA